MVTHCHRPNERNKVQAFNDFLVFGSMALGSFASGAVLVSFGWSAVNEIVFPVALAATALLIWGALRGRSQSPDARGRRILGCVDYPGRCQGESWRDLIFPTARHL